jgi:hypothetical protein
VSIPEFLKHDALAMRLIRLGHHSESAFAVVERVALMTESGMAEYDAIEAVLKWVPMKADEPKEANA